MARKKVYFSARATPAVDALITMTMHYEGGTVVPTLGANETFWVESISAFATSTAVVSVVANHGGAAVAGTPPANDVLFVFPSGGGSAGKAFNTDSLFAGSLGVMPVVNVVTGGASTVHVVGVGYIVE